MHKDMPLEKKNKKTSMLLTYGFRSLHCKVFDNFSKVKINVVVTQSDGKSGKRNKVIMCNFSIFEWVPTLSHLKWRYK